MRRSIRIYRVAAFTVLLCAAALVSTSVGAPAPGSSDADQTRLKAPLLRYKLELARQGQRYLHLLPEAVVIYFRGVELKRLTVQDSWRLQQRLLAQGRVRDWEPRRRDPMLLAGENRPVDALHFLESLVTLDKMPPTFSVLLADDTLIQVTASESDRFHPERRRVSLAAESGTLPPDVIQLVMQPDDARQLYWLLEEGLGVIF